MERKSTTITEEYDKSGILLRKTTETVEEKDDCGYIYPHHCQKSIRPGGPGGSCIEGSSIDWTKFTGAC